MNVTLYSTHCPKCNVLAKKLEQKGMQFQESNDIQKIIDMGFLYAPVLEVDGKYMDFKSATDWLKEQ